MTLRTKTLTAVAALSISAAGVWAQTATTEAPVTIEVAPEATAPATTEVTRTVPIQPVTGEAPATETAPVETAPAAPAEAAPAAETPAAADAPATEAPAAEAPAAETPAAETPAPAPETAATEAELEEAAAEEEAVEDAPVEAADETTPVEVAADDAAADAGAEDAAAEAAAEAPAEPELPEIHEYIPDVSFSFEGPFGRYDQFQLQRGLQVYTEVCAGCHGLRYVPIRTLSDKNGPGLPEDQVREYATRFFVMGDDGMERPAEPTDHFPAQLAEGMGPDLSLMAKARAGFHGPYGTGIAQLFQGIGGAEYIHAILTGYTGETQEQAGALFYQNTAFHGGLISMAPPLFDGSVEYADGTEATIDQMAMDVSAFLMWAAEPRMMERKQMGLVSVLFLIVLTVLLYLTNKRLWAPVKGKKH